MQLKFTFQLLLPLIHTPKWFQKQIQISSPRPYCFAWYQTFENLINFSHNMKNANEENTPCKLLLLIWRLFSSSPTEDFEISSCRCLKHLIKKCATPAQSINSLHCVHRPVSMAFSRDCKNSILTVWCYEERIFLLIKSEIWTNISLWLIQL